MIGFTKIGLAGQQTPGLLVSRPPCHSEYPPRDGPIPLPKRRLHPHPLPAPASRAESGRVLHALDWKPFELPFQLFHRLSHTLSFVVCAGVCRKCSVAGVAVMQEYGQVVATDFTVGKKLRLAFEIFLRFFPSGLWRLTPGLSCCRKRERSGRWRQSAPGPCSARALAGAQLQGFCLPSGPGKTSSYPHC